MYAACRPSRRTVLAGVASLAATPGRAATPFGRIASPEVTSLLDGMARIDDGDPSKPRVRVVFSPGCSHSVRLFRESRARRMSASWRWIPLGGDAKGRLVCAAALEDGSVAGLEAALEGRLPPAASAGRMPAQDALLEGKVGRLLWDATQSALATPTLVYVTGNGLHMAVRGSIPEDMVARLVGAAA